MKYSVVILYIAMTVLLNICKHKAEPEHKTRDSVIAIEQVKDTTAIATEDSSNTDNSISDNPSWKNEDIVTGMATYRLSYCGGVKPSSETEERFKTEYPLALQNIRLENAANPTETVNVKTDASGYFSAGLHVGIWNYYLIATPGSNTPPNPNCQKYYDRRYGSFTVQAGTRSGTHLLYSFPCDPCSPPRP